MVAFGGKLRCMEIIWGHLVCPLCRGCPLFGGSAMGGSTVLLSEVILVLGHAISYSYIFFHLSALNTQLHSSPV